MLLRSISLVRRSSRFPASAPRAALTVRPLFDCMNRALLQRVKVRFPQQQRHASAGIRLPVLRQGKAARVLAEAAPSEKHLHSALLLG
jgi:hypothetical protein